MTIRFISRSIRAIQLILSVLHAYIEVVVYVIRNTIFGFREASRYTNTLSSRALIKVLRLYGASVGKNCDIQPGITFHNCKNFKNLTIGNNCHIGKNCFFDLRNSVTIEANVVISMFSRFVTHIDITKSELSQEFPATSAPIKIGHDSYLGIGTTVLMGVEIGSKVVVAANSLVNVSIPDNSRVAGTPCKNIK